ncbi:LacI family DNA-binding transcriptional regulator [Pinibacter soli]|uniref:LacI family DNA-binding transcriptional regulator n=1 Tax=Pinibacter soli TaxID=3044211 RepID=A0ABT6RJR0_9BACT|nr:LacI family DNA-binding transcriptional regulator [Pinibacter soli]MDI3322711.1 LacI family DNA-binding transcriptional regulator [Pinibacter soli]
MAEKQPTIKEIAKRLNISISTVSRALHNHPSIGLKTKTLVQQLAQKLDYEPNQMAISLQQRKTFTLGVILPGLSESFFSSAISGIEEVANMNGYTVLMGQSHDDIEREKQLMETMKKHRVDGLIISITKNTKTFEHFEFFKKANIPVVFFDRIPDMNDINYVACNILSGTIKAISYLLKARHRVIGMINGPKTLVATAERRDGYMQAMQKNRLKFDPSLVFNCDLSKESVYEATQKLLSHSRKPTAIVTFNDYVAMDAMHYATQQNICVNKDLLFVSYVNLPMLPHLKFRPIASVEQYPFKQGQKAAQMLVELLQNKIENTERQMHYKIIIDSDLVIHA